MFTAVRVAALEDVADRGAEEGPEYGDQAGEDRCHAPMGARLRLGPPDVGTVRASYRSSVTCRDLTGNAATSPCPNLRGPSLVVVLEHVATFLFALGAGGCPDRLVAFQA